jgi:hypothetical protein
LLARVRQFLLTARVAGATARPRLGAPGSLFSNIREKRSFHFTKWFQPVEPEALVGAVLHLQLHPLDVDLRIELGTGALGR